MKKQYICNNSLLLSLSVLHLFTLQLTEFTHMTTSGYTSDDRGRINRFAVEPRKKAQKEPVFGFNKNAERYSGRLAMIGFVGILMFELATNLTFVQIVTGV